MSSSENLINSFFEHEAKDNFKLEVVLKPCQICGRTFNPQSLERHEKVCEKTKKSIRRNVFNSFSQRAKELGGIPVLNDVKEEEKKKCRKWKEEHENISRVIKGDKHSSSNIMNNGSSQQKKVPSGHQQCPSCNRCFNEKAAERHIAWCTEQQTRMPKTPPSSEALKRLKARVKYKAPLPKRRFNNDSNIRLVKSAESIREPTILRTHSSPPIPVQSLRTSRQSNENLNSSTNKLHTQIKAEKKNKNLDMLAALRLRLSELETSDDFLDDSSCFMNRPNDNELHGNQSKRCNFPSATPASREIWTSDGEVHCSTSSSSDGSLPSLSRAGSSEQRMPRFCYNCGTKYPIVSAKFCCECGARRFVFGANNNQMYAV